MLVDVIKTKLYQLKTDRYVFKDDKGKPLPIDVCGIEIYGIYISPMGTVWLVDGTYVRHDAFNNIQPWYWGDKHLASSFNDKSLRKVIDERL